MNRETAINGLVLAAVTAVEEIRGGTPGDAEVVLLSALRGLPADLEAFGGLTRTECRSCGGSGEVESTSPTSAERWTCGACGGTGRGPSDVG